MHSQKVNVQEKGDGGADPVAVSRSLHGLIASPTFNKGTLESRTNVFKAVPEYKYENIAFCKE